MVTKHEEYRKKLIFIIKMLLNSMTIFEIDEEIHYFYKYWYFVFTTFTSISVVSSEISVYLFANNSYERFLAIQSAGAIFSSNSIFLASQIYSKNLIDIYYAVKDGIKNKTMKCELKITNEDVLKLCISWSRRFGRLIIAFAMNTVLSTTMMAIITKRYESSDGTTLIYASRYPWYFDTLVTYSLTYFLQVVSSVPVFLIFWGNMTFMTITVIIFQAYTDELVYLMQNPYFSKNSIPMEENEHYEHLKKCVQLHQQLRKHFIKFKSWFDVVFNAEIAYVTVQVGTLSFVVLQEKQTYGNSVKLFFFMVVILAQLYFHCNIGENFYEMNNILTETLYDLVLEAKSNKVRKLMLMFMQQTQIPYALTAFRTFRTSLQIFTTLIRLSYSFLNVLRASVK